MTSTIGSANLQRKVQSVLFRLGLRVRGLRRRALDGRAIAGYLRTHPVSKLQLGTGPNPLPGWLNTDLFPDVDPEHRAVIVMRHLLEYTPGEIAEALGLPRGTVNSRLRRGLDELADRLDQDVQ